MEEKELGYVNYDVNVSLMRIVACLIVIGCHIRLSVISDNIIDKSKLFIDGFFDDGVAIFFCIVGFFIYNNNSYKKLWKKVLIKILLPAFLLECLTVFLAKYFSGYDIIESIKSPIVNGWVLLRDLFSFEYVNGGFTVHLWYISSYIGIIIAFPVTKLIVDEYNKKNKKILYWVIGISILNIIINDVQQIYMFPGGKIKSYSIFDFPVFYCLLGFLLYEKKDLIKGKKRLRFILVCGIVVVNTFRYYVQLYLFSVDLNNNYFYFANTGFACLSSVMFILFFMTFRIERIKIQKILNYIGAQTFFIYLIHIIIYHIIDKWVGRQNIIDLFGEGVIGYISYTVFYALFIFIICFGIICFSRYFILIYRKFAKLFRRS